MASVRTDSGTLVRGKSADADSPQTTPLTEDEATKDAAIRNERAAALGIQTRYVVSEV